MLEKGEESLLARGWLSDHAMRSIDVQYFIWSTDNIGKLAAETLLRAAERGVHVRVIVDDLLIDASDQSLVALAKHPKIEIRIYNPKHSVGTPFVKRLFNLFTDFRKFNQRMHNKTFNVDGKIAITGGRNMADEYFDYDHRYNFRDRDVLLIGPAAAAIKNNFETYWNSGLVVHIEDLLKQKIINMDDYERQLYYEGLHKYAGNPENFEKKIWKMLINLPSRFKLLIDSLIWDKVKVASDQPGKNNVKKGLGKGGQLTGALANLVRDAKNTITIQSPYLVMPDGGLELFKEVIARGVDVHISTNSLAASDNLYASSGFIDQRDELLETGINIFEYKPRPAIRKKLIDRFEELNKTTPIFAIHAKTMVVDGEKLFVGTFNLDPRSANLNTEVGVIINNKLLARQVENQIKIDMLPENSWESGKENNDQETSLLRRLRVRFWRFMPIDDLI